MKVICFFFFLLLLLLLFCNTYIVSLYVFDPFTIPLIQTPTTFLRAINPPLKYVTSSFYFCFAHNLLLFWGFYSFYLLNLFIITSLLFYFCFFLFFFLSFDISFSFLLLLGTRNCFSLYFTHLARAASSYFVLLVLSPSLSLLGFSATPRDKQETKKKEQNRTEKNILLKTKTKAKKESKRVTLSFCKLLHFDFHL
ncbi:hypothetical protein TbgDal_VIII6590 [Trypanosoma brucei gambiense DAL972]|uniref:Uncharacterized protein n=1 Tax=Trypanosoma brucei gambiense (strain MHOM/CI/86/DAL972) TaxID=679716 RepID=C9ZWD2_TRYB9|nr:hypothetical protein TbgDal_VIII6590 [Trypanosoma brucei gambiense DAL972]CBH13721.1 hypothetical protein TbgDal_VIII6590 [Trypanosoma brucei gambiense DAL972]|eukprot:XP_011775997.1 hypothetical protein TbgDal_VIII6590 [Trypanosoma brucei gambiense DAL972]